MYDYTDVIEEQNAKKLSRLQTQTQSQSSKRQN